MSEPYNPLSLTFLTQEPPEQGSPSKDCQILGRLINDHPPRRAPSNSLASQASCSWPSRLTTAINPTKKQDAKAKQLPDRGPNLLTNSAFCSSVCESPFSVCPGCRAHRNGALPIVLTRLRRPLQLLAGCCVCKLLAVRPSRAGGPVQMPPTIKTGVDSQHSEAVSDSRHVLTRPVATNRLVPRSTHLYMSSPNGAQTAGAIRPCKTAEPRTPGEKEMIFSLLLARLQASVNVG